MDAVSKPERKVDNCNRPRSELGSVENDDTSKKSLMPVNYGDKKAITFRSCYEIKPRSGLMSLGGDTFG